MNDVWAASGISFLAIVEMTNQQFESKDDWMKLRLYPDRQHWFALEKDLITNFAGNFA